MNIGRRFKLFRKRKNLTQQEAANLIGVKSYQLANYESNRSEPSIKVLIAMSKAYDASIDNLLGNINTFNDQENETFDKEKKDLFDKVKKLLQEYEPFYKD
jgi:transcriptional regulator with XRE-family HTH domain